MKKAVRAKRKKPVRLADPARGYALIVGGTIPYVGPFVSSLCNPAARDQVLAQCTEPFHHCKPAVVIPLADYRRLLQSRKAKP